ncbi:MAG: hypothetical protein ACKOEM_10135 [Planctomycetia bacterium]|jgi:hypothetical protein
MHRALVLVFAAALLCTGGAKKPVIDLRIHGEGIAAEAPTFAFPATLLNGREVYLSRMPLITQREVRSIYPFPAADGSEGVYLKLDNHGTGLLQQHTMERRGRTLVVLLNGRQVTNLLVDRPVTDGIVSIPRGLSPEDIALLRTAFPVIGETGGPRR